MERKLISACVQDRGVYDQLLSTEIATELSDPAKIVYDEIREYYNKDTQAMAVDIDIVKQNIERKYPKHFKALNGVLDNLQQVSTTNVLDTYIAMKKNRVGMRLSSALLGGDNKEISALMDEYISVEDISSLENSAEEDEIYIGASLKDLGVEDEREFTLYPKSLQERTRGADRGHHILIYARPEAGKTLISINMSAMFCKNGYKVLYVGNEDPATDMLTRFMSRLTGLSRHEILNDYDTAHTAAVAAGYENLIFKTATPGTIGEIRGLIERYKPDVLVVDQIRNLDVKMEGLVNILETSAKEIRNLGKKYKMLTISVAQAGDSATDKLVLGMSDVDSSKTGLPAAIDLMIGIGTNRDFEQTNRRMFSLPKNKLGADHSFFPVSVDPTLSKVNSI